MDRRSKLNIQIYREASEWFVECRAGDLDDNTRRAFDSWLRKSPEHLRAYLEVSAIWNEGSLLDPRGKFDQDTLIAEAVADRDNVIDWSGVRNGIDALVAVPLAAAATTPAATPKQHAQRWFSRRRFAAIAASLVLASGAAIYYARTLEAPTYATAIGEQRSLALVDGSTVELNSRSKIVVRYTPQGRNVELLQGQALFRVAKDASRPFIVKTGATLVRAVGTEFDVYKKRDGTVVTVVEGRVAILTDRPIAVPGQSVSPVASNEPRRSNLEFPTVLPEQVGNIMVAAGEQLTVTPRQIQIAEHPNIANATAWTQRQLVFESASLADVADEFNRYNDRQLIVADPRLGTFHVSGVFSSTDPASLIRFLRERPELKILETESQIRIEKNTS